MTSNPARASRLQSVRPVRRVAGSLGSITRMKRCTYCGREHPDEAALCSLDQNPLEFVTSPSATPESSKSQPGKGWPPQIVVPAVLWLALNFLLVGLFTIGASFLFGLL